MNIDNIAISDSIKYDVIVPSIVSPLLLTNYEHCIVIGNFMGMKTETKDGSKVSTLTMKIDQYVALDIVPVKDGQDISLIEQFTLKQPESFLSVKIIVHGDAELNDIWPHDDDGFSYAKTRMGEIIQAKSNGYILSLNDLII